MSLAVGDTLSAPEQRVRPDMMHVWAKVLRDPNPIHLDPDAVRARGLGDRVINQGPGNVSYIMNLLLSAFPRGRLAEIKMRFLDNVFGGDMAQPTAIVTRIEDTAEGRFIAFDIALYASGRLVLDGEAVVLTPLG
ncbi:MAG TPA: MaoC/PaaZ C-terminal domain-containing protein [Caulobacterales bacterium]|nr:MaoC/PaaZ C-terminal domain-containing protein [Caulobacterales bacterium]